MYTHIRVTKDLHAKLKELAKQEKVSICTLIESKLNVNINALGVNIEKIPINTTIAAFKQINPAYKNFYKNTTQRKALQRLIEAHGQERIISIITSVLPKTNQMKYAPTITTPNQLEEKYANLAYYLMSVRITAC